MSNEKRHNATVYRLYEELCENHVSKKNAISGRDLSAKFEFTPRQLRDYVREIRGSSEFTKVVLTCNKGYYIPTEEEGAADVKMLFRHSLSTLKIAKAIVKKAEMDKQCKIPLGDYCKEFVEAFGSAE